MMIIKIIIIFTWPGGKGDGCGVGGGDGHGHALDANKGKVIVLDDSRPINKWPSHYYAPPASQ